MGLLFLGTSSWDVAGPPEWTPSAYDLDTLVIPYRGRYDQLDAFLSSHPAGEPSPIDSNMFLMAKLPDDHKQFPTVRLSYSGKRGGVLPPGRPEQDEEVQSASSKRNKSGFFVAQPMVLEFYAPTSVLSYYTRGNPGTDQAIDPISDPRPIILTAYDTAYAITGSVQETVDIFYSVQQIATNKATEVVPNRQYWRNVSKKTKIYSPWIFTVPSGPFITLYNPGTNYRVGDHLTVPGPGGVANLVVTAVLVLWGNQNNGGVFTWTVSSNTISSSANMLPAVGGSGNGAAFNVVILP